MSMSSEQDTMTENNTITDAQADAILRDMFGRKPRTTIPEDRIADIVRVCKAATLAITDTMIAAFPKHKTGDWLSEGADHHVARALAHVRKLIIGDKSEPHLLHAVTRLTMAMECGKAVR